MLKNEASSVIGKTKKLSCQSMWCRISTPFWKPFVGLLGTVALSGYAFGFVGSHPSTAFQQCRARKSHRNDLLPSHPLSLMKNTLCEEGSIEKDIRSEIEGYQRMKLPERGNPDNGHAIFNLLLGENMIESYDIYRRPDAYDSEEHDNVIIAYVKLGNRIDGHPGVVHGGILSLIFDDALGFGYEALGVKMAVTANLNVDFRAPVMAGTAIRIVAQLDHREGRKLYWKAQMTSMDQKILYAEATSLYIVPRSAES